ncbi:multidrug effflux MFS transporter [Mucilaginibacter sp. KACC 22773]|uniref:multidrug effflux MFS transporter n=1 Tax=Mucilaginibacter sp. KACC 22773 TaxID=3025671 RepID=UPI0023672D9B|nr:multidrug effflux MFS transporter [Mucilaginibacter sp. KACC 22773]WDF76298.1 multidrug effflux MFS transporter [Mucilaginibacter sp. KACC 22773]
MTKKRYFFLILILGSLTALAPFSIDMYLPAFDTIAAYLHTSPEQMTLTMSSFFIGISAGQLLYGPLLDRFGRKRPLYFGLILYIVASIGCFFSTSLPILVGMRFFEAIGGCAATVAAMTMVRDLFPVKDNAKVFALLILVLGASPMLAPTAGTAIVNHFEWQAIFLVLTVIAVLIFIAVFFFLPESYKPDPTYSLKPVPIITNFWAVIKEPQFFTYAVSGAFIFAGLFTYVASSSLVFIGIFKISKGAFGWVFGGLSIGFIGASQVNSLLVRYYKSERIINVTVVCLVIISAIFLTGSLNGWFGMAGTIVMIFGVLCCVGISSPNASALSLAPFTKNAGSASALMGALQMAIGALASYGITLIQNQGTLPMAGVMAASSVVAFVVLFVGKRFIKNKVEAVAGAAVAAH